MLLLALLAVYDAEFNFYSLADGGLTLNKSSLLSFFLLDDLLLIESLTVDSSFFICTYDSSILTYFNLLCY
jgi:hypothetical protein